jgi:hypothetical protein
MKWIVPFAVMAVVLSSCASPRLSRANFVTVVGAPADPDNSQPWFPKAFRVGDKRFGTLEDFKAFIVTLAPGSVVRCDSGCIRYEMMPLAHSDMTIHEFKQYCEQHGVTFEYIASGY